MLAGLGPCEQLVAADVGAGTGISARALAGRGVSVIALEPNAAMRDAAEPHERIEWRAGTAEATGLAAASVGLVLCAQAFHWFRHREALAEFHRILRPGGRLALLWNSRDETDPLTQGYAAAIRSVIGEHPADTRAFDAGVVGADGRFTPPRLQTFAHAQELDGDGLIGRATSASYVPREGVELARLEAELDLLWGRLRDGRGVVTMRYVTELYLAESLAPFAQPVSGPRRRAQDGNRPRPS